MSEPDAAPAAPASCAAFWGPLRPLFGGHSVAEAGGSAFVPTWLLMITRFASATFMFVTLVYYLVDRRYFWRFYSLWCHFGLSISFFTSAFASLRLLLTAKRADVHRASTFSGLVVFLFQIFASAALFLDVVYWSVLFKGGPHFDRIAQHAVNIILVLVDMCLALKMNFKLFYTFMFVVYTVIFVVFAWIFFAVQDEWVYSFLDYEERGPGLTVAIYLGLILWGVVAGVLVFLLSRLNRLACVKNREAAVSEEEPVMGARVDLSPPDDASFSEA